jgi:hypothetical protein
LDGGGADAAFHEPREKADLIIKMPYSLSTLTRLYEVTRLDEAVLQAQPSRPRTTAMASR